MTRIILSLSVVCLGALVAGQVVADEDKNAMKETHEGVKNASHSVADDLGIRGDVSGSDSSSSNEGSGSSGESSGLKASGKKVADDLGISSSVTHGNQYGPAGCGLGSLIFEPNSGFTQIFAATTNTTFGTQTFGITSGTSNCENTNGGSASAKAFVETNRGALAKDIARGNGESIAALSQLAGCPDASSVGRVLQRNFTRIFPDQSAADTDVSSAVVQVLRADATLDCKSLG